MTLHWIERKMERMGQPCVRMGWKGRYTVDEDVGTDGVSKAPTDHWASRGHAALGVGAPHGGDRRRADRGADICGHQGFRVSSVDHHRPCWPDRQVDEP